MSTKPSHFINTQEDDRAGRVFFFVSDLASAVLGLNFLERRDNPGNLSRTTANSTPTLHAVLLIDHHLISLVSHIILLITYISTYLSIYCMACRSLCSILHSQCDVQARAIWALRPERNRSLPALDGIAFVEQASLPPDSRLRTPEILLAPISP